MNTDLVAALRLHEAAWYARPLVRALYRDWFRQLGDRLADVPGASVELGAGIGTFGELYPEVVLTDVEPTPWVDETADAEQLRWGDGELANLVLVDVFHHLPDPARFLDEAVRTLAPGGRVLILDPYCSPISTVLYRAFHRERTDLSADPFGADPLAAEHPLASNQARATLVFFRAAEELRRRWPQLRIAERRRLALLAYPLSGGFESRPLVPARIGTLLHRAEPALAPLAPLLAFRCLVVLERT